MFKGHSDRNLITISYPYFRFTHFRNITFTFIVFAGIKQPFKSFKESGFTIAIIANNQSKTVDNSKQFSP